MNLLYRFAISEGVLSKEQILNLGNKSLLYRMKNNHYIKETIKGSGIYKSTPKLKQLTEKTTGISYGNGCSFKHSEKIQKAISFFPKEVISEGRFSSGLMLKQEVSSIKQTPQYQKAINNLQKNVLKEEKNIQYQYQNFLSTCNNQAERYQAQIDFQAQSAYCQIKKEVAFSDTPIFIPDFKVNVTKEEGEYLLQQFTEQMHHLSENSKEYHFLERNVAKVQHILQSQDSTFDLYFEIITNNYGKPELERHFNYETILNREVLYIY